MPSDMSLELTIIESNQDACISQLSRLPLSFSRKKKRKEKREKKEEAEAEEEKRTVSASRGGEGEFRGLKSRSLKRDLIALARTRK
jgi:hypothetical protein